MPRTSSHTARASRRGRRTARRLRILVPLFVIALVLGMAGSVALAWWGTSLIEQDGVEGLTPADTKVEQRIVNVLVVGDDSREGLSRAQIREFGTGRAEGNRTDSVMLVQLEVNGKGRAAALSFPRDLRVERCDGSVGRINAAYTIGLARDGDGASCLVDTITDLTGIPIHHYVEVSFAGFVKVVDAIGGVTLYLDEPLSDAKAHIDLQAGCVTLAGGDALGFVRARHVDNDFGRIARQQRFVKETLKQATSLGVLANPQRLLALVDAASGAVRTDDQLGLAEMQQLAQGMRAATADKFKVHTVPAVDQRIGAAWYVVELPQEAAKLYRAFRSGEVLDGPPQVTEAAPPPIELLNADGSPGLAAAAAAFLQARGVDVGEVGNSEIEGMPDTEVRYPPHLEHAAARVADLLGGVELVEGDADQTFMVELGGDLNAKALARRAAAPTRQQPARETAPPDAPGLASQTYTGASDKGVDC